MTLVCYASIDTSLDTEKLPLKVRGAFPHKENDAYFNEISARKNAASVQKSLCSLLLLSRLCDRLGRDCSSLILEREENGKPYFRGSRLNFSISHSKGYVAAALSDDVGVGIDIECSVFSREKAEKLAKRYFSASEMASFDGSPESFARIWTEKEARVKLLGSTLAEMVAKDKKSAENRAEYNENVFFEHFDAEGYPLTLCLSDVTNTMEFFCVEITELLLG